MTASIRLYLARHGRTAWNVEQRVQGHTDVPLDDVGRAQALELAGVLRGRISAVIASDLLRASESARVIAQALQLPLLALDPELRERCYGIFEGLTRAECRARYPHWSQQRKRDRNVTLPGSEPQAVVVARMQRALERAVDGLRGKHQSALVLGHGSSLRMFLEALSGRPEASFANMEFRQVLHVDSRFVLE